MKDLKDDNLHPHNHMNRHIENVGGLVKYNLSTDLYYLTVSQGREHLTTQDIYYCPWCGDKLPTGYNDLWHSELERLNINWMEDDIPQRFLTDEWRKSL